MALGNYDINPVKNRWQDLKIDAHRCSPSSQTFVLWMCKARSEITQNTAVVSEKEVFRNDGLVGPEYKCTSYFIH